MKCLDHRPDVTVFENPEWLFPNSPHDDHAAGQIIGPNYLVREQHAKYGIDCPQQAVAEIRFLPRLHGIDVRGPE
jgi:hypothetical protein